MGREGALRLGVGTQNLRHKRFFSAGIQDGSAPSGWVRLDPETIGGERHRLGPRLGHPGRGDDEALTFTVRLKAPLSSSWNKARLGAV